LVEAKVPATQSSQRDLPATPANLPGKQCSHAPRLSKKPELQAHLPRIDRNTFPGGQALQTLSLMSNDSSPEQIANDVNDPEIVIAPCATVNFSFANWNSIALPKNDNDPDCELAMSTIVGVPMLNRRPPLEFTICNCCNIILPSGSAVFGL